MIDSTHDQTQHAPLTIDAQARLSLRDHVRNQLRMAIISGRFAAGEKLNERALAEEMDVSTTPLKEALRQLEAEGLVEVLPRRGLIVRFDAQFAHEMILARAALESPIAALAAQRIDAEGRQRLEATVKLMEVATRSANVSDLIVLNEAFHGEIHRASGSIHLVRMVAQQQFYDDSARRVIHRDAAESRAAFDEHRAICAAIVSGDQDAAHSAMNDHVLRSGQLYLSYAFKQEPNS